MNMKMNMALAALVIAGLIAWISGFTSQQAVHAEDITKDAVTIEAAAAVGAGAGAAKAAAVEPILAMIATADLERGKSVAKACAACHSFDNGGKNGVGPNLYGIVGRKKDSVAGYAYSGSLEKQGGAIWTYEELNKFLWKPKAYAPGTKMTYVGIKKSEDRAAVIAYLRSYNNAALPSPAEIEKEKADLGGAVAVETPPVPAAATTVPAAAPAEPAKH